MNPTLDPTTRALIIEASTREAHAWTFALVAAALAATFCLLWLASLRDRAQAGVASSHALTAESSPKYLQRRRAA